MEGAIGKVAEQHQLKGVPFGHGIFWAANELVSDSFPIITYLRHDILVLLRGSSIESKLESVGIKFYKEVL